jgi:hypothetical protein
MFALRFSTDAKYVASASLDGSSALWDIEEKKLVRVYKAHTGMFGFVVLESA